MSAVRIEPYTFEPCIHSMEELRFLLDHLEEPPNAALYRGVPAGVNPVQIQRTLGQFQELAQLQKFQKVPWAGFEAIRDSILRYLAWDERRLEIFRLTGGASGQQAIAHASQYGWDSSGKAFRFAIDADSAEAVRTEILDDGTRRAFGVKLLQPDGVPAADELANVAPWVARTRAVAVSKDDVITKEDPAVKMGTYTCSICGRAEQYSLGSLGSKGGARARIGRHLKGAKVEVARHRMLYRKLFESPTARL